MKVLISKTVICSLLIASTLAPQAFAANNTQYTTTMAVPENRPTFGFNLDPIWLVLGGIGAKAEYFVSDRVSLGVGGIFIPRRDNRTTSDNDTTYTSTTKYKWEHNEIHLGTNIMLTGTLGTRGLYINPAVGYMNTRISEYGEYKLSGALSTPMARLTMGYQWVIVNHLRLAAGGGFTATQSGTVVVKDADGQEVLKDSSSSMGGLALDLQVGYVF
jgi:hypothetical protein